MTDTTAVLTEEKVSLIKYALDTFDKAEPVIQLVILIIVGLYIFSKRKNGVRYVRSEDCHNHIDGLKEMIRLNFETVDKKLDLLEKYIKERFKLIEQSD